MQTLYAIDTMAVIYRSHFAMIRNPLINSRGVNVSGLHGLLHTLVTILEKRAPDYLAVVSDGPEATFRHAKFPDYKATREKMPDELVSQLPYIPRIVEALNLPYLLVPGYEADDIIGTLVEQANQRKLESYMVTGDKDYMQLVGDHAFMFAAKGEEIQLTDAARVAERFGCTPDRVIEVLALMGDSSDNVPGVKGVGPKTATRLVADYDTLENLYDHLDEVKGEKLKENLRADRERAFLSRELVTIARDVPLGISFDDLAVHPTVLAQNAALIDLLTELEFQSLRDRLLKKEGDGAPAAPAERLAYHTLDSLEAIRAVLPTWQQAGLLVFDTETTGLDYLQDELVGLSFAVAPREAWYIALNSPGLEGRRAEVLELLRPLLTRPEPPKGGHNMKFDLHMLLSAGIEVEGAAHDTMIASHLTEPAERRHDLDSVALRKLGITKIPTEELIGKGKTQTTMDRVPIAKVSHYACEDADVTFRLVEALTPRLEEMNQRGVFDRVEMPLVPVLTRMEQAGIRFDQAGGERLSRHMERRLEEARERIFELAETRDFNINSHIDLQHVLYERLELHKKLGVRPRKIKTGIGLSTDEDTLVRMSGHPLPRAILDYRELAKLKSTYLDQLGGYVSPVTGKIHTSFRQTVAATGRLSCDSPNLQNIPIRSEEGREVRRLFVPSDAEHVLLSADYSQIELRVVADYSGDPTFIEAFRSGADIHALTGAAIFGVPPEQVDRDMRAVAKEVNFGLIYRMGADTLAQVTGRTRAEAREFIDRFFAKYHVIRTLQEELVERAKRQGYAETKLGRRRYLAELHSNNAFAARTAEGMAINSPIQGTAAEIIKLAMIAIDRRLRAEGLAGRMVLTIHDELLFDVPKGEVDALRALVKEEMEGAMALAVPLEVEIGVGDTWLAAH